MNPAFRWSDLPLWLEAEIASDLKLLEGERPEEDTIRIRTRLRVYRKILSLPELDPSRGKKPREMIDG